MLQRDASGTSIVDYLRVLAEDIGARPTGSQANQRAGRFIRDVFTRLGWHVETPAFDCLSWQHSGAELRCNGHRFEVGVDPFSPSYDGTRPFIVLRNPDELFSHADLSGRIVLLADALAAFPYMPLNYPFVKFEDQQAVLKHLNTADASAVVGISPEPLFSDGDVSFASVHLAPNEFDHLLTLHDKALSLSIRSSRVPSTGFNVIARSRGAHNRKIVICAHYDTWFDTPGAADNAAGVSVLLALAEILDPKNTPVEFVAFSGEDHYASPGEVQYLAGGTDDIDLVVNIDGVGVAGHQIGAATFGDLGVRSATFARESAAIASVVPADPWFQGDHTIFVQRGIPAIALSSHPFDDWLALTHNAGDTVDNLDVALIADTVEFVRRIVTAN